MWALDPRRAVTLLWRQSAWQAVGVLQIRRAACAAPPVMWLSQELKLRESNLCHYKFTHFHPVYCVDASVSILIMRTSIGTSIGGDHGPGDVVGQEHSYHRCGRCCPLL